MRGSIDCCVIPHSDHANKRLWQMREIVRERKTLIYGGTPQSVLVSCPSHTHLGGVMLLLHFYSNVVQNQPTRRSK